MRLFSVPSFQWKRRSPRAAAQLHLDSSLPERQACCTHCPDSYLCNCVPVREERRWSWQQHCPCSKTEDMLQWRLWSAGAFSSTIKRDIGAALSALTYIQAPDVSEGCHWLFYANRPLQVHWDESQVQLRFLWNRAVQAKSALTMFYHACLQRQGSLTAT